MDSWMRWALLSSLSDGAQEVFVASVQDRALLEAPGGIDWLRQLATLIGAQGRPSGIQPVLDWVMAGRNEGIAFPVALALLDGERRGGRSGSPVDRRLVELSTRARAVAEEAGMPEPLRIDAVRLLGHTPGEQTRAVLEPLLAGGSEGLRREAIRTLALDADPAVNRALLRFWSGYTASLRNEVLNVVISRRSGALELLEAVDSGSVPKADIPAAVIQALRANRDSGVAARAARVFPPGPDSAARVRIFEPALSMKGDVGRGRAVYRERCASCHRWGADGIRLGPDLVTVKSAGRDRLLSSILNPHAEVAPQFVAFEVETREGDQHVAVIDRETPSAVTLRMGGGQEIILPRSQVRSMTSSGRSLMPEGLADGLSVQAMADLLEFIAAAEPPAGAM